MQRAKRVILGAILAVVCALIIYMGGEKWLASHDRTLIPRNPLSLNDRIQRGEDFPVGAYAALDCRYPIGWYASETKASVIGTWSHVDDVTKYYLALLEDRSLITVKVSRQADTDALDALSEELETNLAAANPRSYPVTGKLVRLTDPDIVSYLKEALAELDIPADDPSVRYLTLDATEILTLLDAAQISLLLIALAAILVSVLAWRKGQKEKRFITES